MLSMMTASAVKRFSATRSTAVKIVEQQWRAHTPFLPEDPAPHRTYPSVNDSNLVRDDRPQG